MLMVHLQSHCSNRVILNILEFQNLSFVLFFQLQCRTSVCQGQLNSQNSVQMAGSCNQFHSSCASDTNCFNSKPLIKMLNSSGLGANSWETSVMISSLPDNRFYCITVFCNFFMIPKYQCYIIHLFSFICERSMLNYVKLLQSQGGRVSHCISFNQQAKHSVKEHTVY